MKITPRHSLEISWLLADLAIWGIVTDSLVMAQLAREFYCYPTAAQSLRMMREYRGLVSERKSQGKRGVFSIATVSLVY